MKGAIYCIFARRKLSSTEAGISKRWQDLRLNSRIQNDQKFRFWTENWIEYLLYDLVCTKGRTPASLWFLNTYNILTHESDFAWRFLCKRRQISTQHLLALTYSIYCLRWELFDVYTNRHLVYWKKLCQKCSNLHKKTLKEPKYYCTVYTKILVKLELYPKYNIQTKCIQEMIEGVREKRLRLIYFECKRSGISNSICHSTGIFIWKNKCLYKLPIVLHKNLDFLHFICTVLLRMLQTNYIYNFKIH